jgi:hypothetical protein
MAELANNPSPLLARQTHKRQSSLPIAKPRLDEHLVIHVWHCSILCVRGSGLAKTSAPLGETTRSFVQ